jgi:glycosyltransferase involved in cell wall biosynthesis
VATKTSNRLNVLISAYACEPGKGSEPGVGWNAVRQGAQNHDVWVITRANNREAIEKALTLVPLPNAHFIYFDIPRWARFWKKGPRGIHLYYYLWQVGAYFAARKIIRSVRFDVAHHITFVTHYYPSFLAFLPIPFVWGPLGGGDSAPLAFWKTCGWKGCAFEILRSIARKRGEWDPFVRRTAHRAAVAVATTPETARRLRSMGVHGRIVLRGVAALNEDDLQALLTVRSRNAGPFRVISVGNLLHLKGFHLGMEAFARLLAQHPESEYWLVGDGPERQHLERLAQRLRIAQRVTFFGKLSRSETLQKMAGCDVMLFPGLHDSSPGASVEAMAAGLPVVCLDLGGLALQVNTATGFKIAALDPDQAILEMADALVLLARDPALRAQMANAGRARVQAEFNWLRVGEEFEALYQEVAASETKVQSLEPAGLAPDVANPQGPATIS